jgi:hypothetical protein
MKRIPTVCLVVATVFVLGAAKPDLQTQADKRKIVGKWVVTKVERDGKPQHGEVGREKGDGITIKLNDFNKLINL